MIPLFLLRLVCGMSLTWCLAPRPQITSGFFRIQMLVTLGLSCLLALTADQISPEESSTDSSFPMMLRAVAVLLAILSFVGSVLWTLERRTGGTRCGMLIAAASACGLVLLVPGPASLMTGLSALQSLASALLLGIVTTTMLLGHWYLTATGMSLAPFITLNRYVGFAACGALVLALSEFRSEWWRGGEIVWATLRLAGLVGPLVLALLTGRILRLRNTQSATGVLYAATILVFMGETAGEILRQSGADS